MGVKLARASGGKAARARQAAGLLQVDVPVGANVVIGREHLQEMVVEFK